MQKTDDSLWLYHPRLGPEAAFLGPGAVAREAPVMRTALGRATLRPVPEAVIRLLLGAILATNCGPGTVRDLEVRSLSRVRVEGADAERLRLTVELEIYNPHGVAARIRDLDCQLALAGDYVAAGRLEGESELPARGSRMIALPLSVAYEKVTEEDFEAVLREEIPYRLSGTATLLEPVERDEIRLELRGSVPAPLRVEADLGGRSNALFLSEPIVRTDLGGLVSGRAVVDVDLENPFRFAIPIEEFDYRVQLRGETIGRGAVARGAVLEPGRNRLQLPIRGDPLRALTGIAIGVLGGGRLDVAVAGTVVIRRGQRRLSIHLDYALTE